MPKIVEDEKVYRAAMLEVIEHGYDGATTKQIAEAADISEVTLFRKYGNKAELIKQAITFMGEQFDFDPVVGYSGDVAADLLRVVKAYQRTVKANGLLLFPLLLEVRRQPELSETISTSLDMINNLGKLLARYQSDGDLVQEHPIHAVAALLGPLIIINLMQNASPDLPLPAVDLPSHVQQFLDGRRPSS